MNKIPSKDQLAAFDRVAPARAVVLFYQFSGDAKPELIRLAAQHGGRLIWGGVQEQVLIGRPGDFRHALQFHFFSRSDARALACNAEHARVLASAATLQVAVLSPQPRAIALLSNLLARVMPWWPFNNAIDPTEEPGVGTSSTMPTAAAIDELKTHPRQDTPVVMVNWLKFRDRAAYMRYGKVALQTTHSLRAKLVCASRYQQILIGENGDPARELWDEFALMQYPGRATFALMGSLKRYRRALPDREAGLAENGQGLVVTQPDAEFTWRA
jgi:hypothetical protein